MATHYERASLLFDHARNDLAVRELQQELAAAPEHATAHALLGHCLGRQGKLDEALLAVAEALRLAPDLAYAHRVRGWLLRQQGHLEQAEAALKEGLRLDPHDVHAFDELAFVQYQQRRYHDAVASANQGLRLNPEHSGCANDRALALSMLGRLSDAESTLQAVLRRDPDDDRTWANHGWILLQGRQPARALVKFREALRLDPENRHSQQGMAEAQEALQNRHAVGLFTAAAVLVILGAALRFVLVPGSPRAVEPLLLRVFLTLLTVGVVFALPALFSPALGYWPLRFSPAGRDFLSPAQVKASNWLGGGCLVVAGTSGAAVLLANTVPATLYSAINLVPLVIPLTITLACPPGRLRKLLAASTVLSVVLGTAGAALALVDSPYVVGTIVGPLFAVFPSLIARDLLAGRSWS
jgi:Flp pilus assembly protein TadD